MQSRIINIHANFGAAIHCLLHVQRQNVPLYRSIIFHFLEQFCQCHKLVRLYPMGGLAIHMLNRQIQTRYYPNFIDGQMTYSGLHKLDDRLCNLKVYEH